MIRRKKNSGYPGIPRNDGMKFTCGEYISFLDSDDLITKTAFEKMYTVAKNFNADIVHCEKFFQFKNTPDDYEIISCRPATQSDEPTLMSDKIEDRINYLINFNFFWNVWSKLVRRDFLLENDLQMTSVSGLEDIIFTCCVACSAKKVVRVPDAINLYRLIETSISHKNNDISKKVKKFTHALIQAIDYLDKFLNEQENLSQRKDLKYMVFDIITSDFMNQLLPTYLQAPAYQFDEIIREELAKVDNKDALTAFIFSRMNMFNIDLIQQQQVIQQLQK